MRASGRVWPNCPQYYRPWDLLPDEEDRIDEQLKETQDRIDKEVAEFEEEKQKRLQEIERSDGVSPL